MLKNIRVLLTTALITLSFLSVTSYAITGEEGTSKKDWEILNFDGNVSLSVVEDRKYWNPHTFGFTNGSEWNVSFSDRVLITLETSSGEAGHIAAGMWWTAGFKDGRKIPLYNREIYVDFDIKVNKFNYEEPNDWLRIALACAIQRDDGRVVYTELDFLDSPNTQKHPTGNIQSGGDIIYLYGNVVEFKIDEVTLNTWKHYRIDLTSYIERAWKIKQNDRLESVYIVIESDGTPVEVELEVDNLWIRSPSQINSII